MKTKIRIGVLGCASIAERSVIPAIKSIPEFELVAIASRTKEKALKFADSFQCKPVTGYENLLLEDLDAVYMPLPTGLHEEWCIKFLNKGIHVFAEKSFGIDYNTTHRIAEVAREKQLVIKENFMFEHHAQHQYLLNLIAENAIGQIHVFKASFGFPPLPMDNFRYDMQIGGGALMDAGAYTVKAAQLILGQNLKYLSSCLNYNKNGSDITGSAHFVSEGFAHAQLSWGFNNYYQCGYEIWGSTGKITTNRSFTAREGFEPSIVVETQNNSQEHLVPSDNHFKNILIDFIKEIKEKKHTDSIEIILKQSKLLDQIRSNAYECNI